jgi:hypothetical protein
MNVLREVMNLSDDKLDEAYRYIRSLILQKEEQEVLEKLVETAVDYTLDSIRNGGTFYTTEEVFDRIDRELEWK